MELDLLRLILMMRLALNHQLDGLSRATSELREELSSKGVLEYGK